MGVINLLTWLLLLAAIADAKVLMEYIGATGIAVNMSDVPVRDGIDFYFILSFAIDSNVDGEYQNGVFSPYWAYTLTPEAVLNEKQLHPNAKAMASLAGWSIYTREGKSKTIFWYNPNDTATWIDNAFTSLSDIVQQYHLDGIDVDYENFPAENNFAFCIGELIKRLKEEGKISTVTIAPYYRTVDPYIALFQNYGSYIDFVNHQFYTDKVTKPASYLADYGMRASQFNASKLLPSYEVDGRGIQGEDFFTALNLILNSSTYGVNGVMIFSADASAKANNSYYYENRTQEFLLSIPGF